MVFSIRRSSKIRRSIWEKMFTNHKIIHPQITANGARALTHTHRVKVSREKYLSHKLAP